MTETIKPTAQHIVEHEGTDEEVFQNYVVDLHLTPEDFEKSILDVGSGSGQFAKWARDHGVSRNIYGIDRNTKLSELADGTNTVIGDAEHLPFRDGAFDLVIASHSTPGDFIDASAPPGAVKDRIRKGLHELLRVAREEVRFGRVGMSKHEDHREFFAQLHEVLDEIATEGVEVAVLPSGKFSEGAGAAFTVSLRKKA